MNFKFYCIIDQSAKHAIKGARILIGRILNVGRGEEENEIFQYFNLQK